MKKFNPLYVLVLLVVASFMASPLGQAKGRRTQQMRDKAKADYLFLEALQYSAPTEPHLDAYFELLQRAHQLNPEDAYIGKDFGYFLLAKYHGLDSVQSERGIELMKRYQQSNPTDETAGKLLASILTQLYRTDEALKSWKLMYDANPMSETAGFAYATALALTGDSANLRKSVTVLNGEEKKFGKSVDISTRKARSLYALEDTTAIETELVSLLAADSSSLENLIFAGEVYNLLDNRQAAVAYLNRAVDKYPSNGAAYYARAQYYAAINDSVAYDREVFNALIHPDLELDTKMGILREYVSELYADSLQIPRISGMFDALVDQYPHEDEVRAMYGSYLGLIGHHEAAREQMSYAVEINPEEENRWINLLALNMMLGDFENALTVCSNAERYYPTNYLFYLYSASAYLNLSQYEKGVKCLNDALAKYSGSFSDKSKAELLSTLGDLYYRMEKNDEALDAYDKALELEPENSQILNNVAFYLACTDRDLDKALKYIELAVALEGYEKNNPTTLDTYAWVEFKLKNYEKAYELINMVLESDEEASSAEVLEHAGDIYFMNGFPDEALDFWKKALKDNPDSDVLKRKVKHKTFFFK